jgi:response regulator RpfG family c-di-GMP phosphodiesterase
VLPRALVVHPSREAAAEIRDALAALVDVEAATSESEALRHIGSERFAVVIVDHRPRLADLASGIDSRKVIHQTVSSIPDAFVILMTAEEQQARDLDSEMPGRVFRFLCGPDQRWQLSGIVFEGLRLQKLEREQRELIKHLGVEYGRLKNREKLLDVVVKERTRELQGAYDALKAASRQALLGLAEAIEAKDPYTKGHCGRTAVFAIALGREAKLSDAELEQLEIGAILHDIGKIGVKDAVLTKPMALDEVEWTHMRIHPLVGAQIASQLDMLRPIVPCIRNHHERWSGGGYPDNLKGESIPLIARIVCLADAYDAMATDRPYKASIPIDECKVILRRQAGPQFDPDLVELFVTRGIMEAFS